MTNADKMRSMPIEEMAEIIARCPYVGRFQRPFAQTLVRSMKSQQKLNEDFMRGERT